MDNKFKDGNVIALCPECKSVTTFEFRSAGGGEYGSVIINKQHTYGFLKEHFNRIIYILLKCAGCGRAGVAKIHCNDRFIDGKMEEFYPSSPEYLDIPNNIPLGIETELREAELCASIKAYRAASVLLRSVLEKTLKINGYIKGNLEDKIDEANNDGVLTDSRKKRAHEDIRVLGNDVLHDEWKAIGKEDFDVAHKYSQRILEDFYDDRSTVEKLLITKGKLKNN